MSKRDSMGYDVVIVGAGVAGLSAAIRLKQLAHEEGRETSIVVLEKGETVGAHILSGALISTFALDQLLPDWRTQGAPLDTRVSQSRLSYLSEKKSWSLPEKLLPPLMRHRKSDAYVGSLGALVRWLGQQAEALGVEIYPGFAATELLYDQQGALKGVATAEQGGEQGLELHGRYTLLAEGARGFLSQELMEKFDLRAGCEPQKYALGLKELWQIRAEAHQAGRVEHYFGWPLTGRLNRGRANGGAFLYHYGDRLVSLGLVVHADYENPALSPFDLLQHFKTHPAISPLLAGGVRLGYGARAITAGGWQSLPRLVFPGGALLGCAAGMVNAASMKGTHNAIVSGCAAALSCHEALCEERSGDELVGYQERVEQGEIARDLKAARFIKPLLTRYGMRRGGALGGAALWLEQGVKRSLPFSLSHVQRDRDSLKKQALQRGARLVPDDVLTFDKASSLHLAGVSHEEDQPSHLVFREAGRALDNRHDLGLEPAQYYCPAGVFELRQSPAGQDFIHLSSSNCLHCKMCDLKDSGVNIRWTPPPKGGPNYVNM